MTTPSPKSDRFLVLLVGLWLSGFLLATVHWIFLPLSIVIAFLLGREARRLMPDGARDFLLDDDDAPRL